MLLTVPLCYGAQTTYRDARQVLDAYHATSLPLGFSMALRAELVQIATLLQEKKTNAAKVAWEKFCETYIKHATKSQIPSIENWVLNKAFFSPASPLASTLKNWEDRVASAGGNTEQANIELQNVLQKQQQSVQMLFNMYKMLNETALAVIRKIG